MRLWCGFRASESQELEVFRARESKGEPSSLLPWGLPGHHYEQLGHCLALPPQSTAVWEKGWSRQELGIGLGGYICWGLKPLQLA